MKEQIIMKFRSSLAVTAALALAFAGVGVQAATATEQDCQTFDRTALSWDWNAERTVEHGGVTLTKPAGGHNSITVTGLPSSITITSNGGTQDRTGQTILNGDYGSDIQSVTVCVPIAPVEVDPAPPVEEQPPAFVPYNESARWIIPASWPSEQTPSYQPAIFPQDQLVGDLPCGRWSQDDLYLIGNPAEADLFASLGDVLTQGEDSAIYFSHAFTYGGDCPPEIIPPIDPPVEEVPPTEEPPVEEPPVVVPPVVEPPVVTHPALPECAAGEEAQPAGDIYVCGPADLPLVDEPQILTPAFSVTTEPAARELAHTGPSPYGALAMAALLLSLGTLFAAIRIWTTRPGPRRKA